MSNKRAETIKIRVADLQVEAKTMSSEKNISVSKVQNMQMEIYAIIKNLSTRIKKEESKENIQQLKSVRS